MNYMSKRLKWSPFRHGDRSKYTLGIIYRKVENLVHLNTGHRFKYSIGTIYRKV